MTSHACHVEVWKEKCILTRGSERLEECWPDTAPPPLWRPNPSDLNRPSHSGRNSRSSLIDMSPFPAVGLSLRQPQQLLARSEAAYAGSARPATSVWVQPLAPKCRT